MTQGISIPQYLERPRESALTFGTLKRTKTKDGSPIWELQGDPQACVMAKRLFPGSTGRGDGQAKFPVTPRVFRDLVWFMQRFPLEILSKDEWERDYKQACDYAIKRERIAMAPQKIAAPAAFKGTLRPFQEEGLSWLMTNRRTLLADDMGLGKTPQALSFLASASEWPALIVVPPHLIRHWQSKIAEFLGDAEMPLFGGSQQFKVHTIRGMKPYALPDANILLIHYLLLRSWRTELKAHGLKTIVFDEVQELRKTDSEKYSAASDLSTRAENVLGLSGTPIYNRGGEIWAVTNAIEYHALGDYDSFTREWCSGYGSDTVKNPAVLGAHLRREGLMLRRRKEDVLGELPAKRRVVQAIDSDEGTFLRLVKEAVSLAKRSRDIVNPLERGRMERDALNETRQATGIAKAPAVSAFVKALLEAEEPTLLFAYHHAVVDRILEDLRDFNPVVISGRQNENEKELSKRAFAEGKTNLCIISLRAAAGLDGLQARARVVVFGELDWSPAVHSQAEDRAHRMGQHDSVLCYYLVSEQGTDPDMQEALGLKVSQFVGLMGDTGETEEDRELATQVSSQHMRAVITKLRSMRGAA